MKLSQQQQQRMADLEFITRVIVFLREQAPAPTSHASDADLSRIVAHGVGVARGYGLATEQHLVEFLLDMLTIHSRFHENQILHAILADSARSASERMAAILSEAPESAWEEAAAYPGADEYWLTAIDTEQAESGETAE